MTYTVLARKYRSLTFDDVIGQEPVSRTLKNAIASGRVAHAYLLCGTRGVGKTTIARILAKALNCLEAEGPTTTPCCRCDSCVAINTGDDLDVIEIDGASNNSVDNVRDLRDNAVYRPTRGRYKVYIIDEVHMLSTSAFNALLKILEEPPEHVKFIFATTEPHKVLATIQSRCQRFDFRNISTADIAGHLQSLCAQEGIKAEEDLILAVAKMANGSMRDGLSLLDRLISVGVQPLTLSHTEEFLGVPSADRIYDLLEAVGRQDAGATLTQLDQLLNQGLGESQVVDALVEALRDLMVLRTAGTEGHLVVLSAAQRQRAQEVLAHFDAAALVTSVTALERIRWSIKNSDAPRALLEATLLRFALSEHFLNVETLLARLEQVDSGAPPKKKLSPDRAPEGGTSARRAEAAGTSGPPNPVAGGVPDGPCPDLATVQANWDALREALRDRLGVATASLLHNARPVGCDSGCLTLQFEPKNHVQKQMCESRADAIQDAIGAFLGCRLRVSFAVAKPLTAPGSPGAPPARSSRRQELLNDPAVKTILLGLDATVTGIEETPEA